MWERVDSIEFTDWIAFYELEPWGSVVEDERAGIVAATVHNNRGMVEPPKMPRGADDFFPRIRRPGRRKTQRELRDDARRAAG